MNDKDFMELETKYYEEVERRKKEKEAQEELERVKKDLENAIQMNGWIDINKITISVDRNVAQGQDGNGGNEHENIKVEIKDIDLFRQCMKLYINELECKSGILEKDLKLEDINKWLSIFKVLKNYDIKQHFLDYTHCNYSIVFGKFSSARMREIKDLLKEMGAMENE